MTQNPNEEHGLCQLQTLPQAATSLAWRDRVRLTALRLTSAAQRRLGGDALPPPAGGESAGRVSAGNDATHLDVGDWVEVRSLEEIHQTLDDSNRCQGLEFMGAMSAYCGQRFQVKKKARAIFDERAWRMLKIRGAFLLEGCVCSGQGMYDKEGCDRCCYFFWRQAWLKKL